MTPRSGSASKRSPCRNPRSPSGFRLANSVQEPHLKSIYSLAWSTDVYRDGSSLSEQKIDKAKTNGGSTEKEKSEQPSEIATSGKSQKGASRFLRCLATCGGNQVSLYEVERSVGTKATSRNLVLRQVYVDPTEGEELYACAFGGRCLGRPFAYGPVHPEDGTPIVLDRSESSLATEKRTGRKRSREGESSVAAMPTREQCFRNMTEMDSFDGPQLLFVAGTGRIIKVIDTVRRMLFFTLSGHEDEIYDLKFSPINEWLLLSASKDESVRLWNVKNATCVGIFAGHEGHRESILTVAWHPLGAAFASGGMDTTVKLWDVDTHTDVYKALQASRAVRPRHWGPTSCSSTEAAPFRTVVEQMPIFSTNKIHVNYVDCIKFVGDLILSKSIDNEIILWKPAGEESAASTNHESAHQPRLPSEAVILRVFRLQKSTSWFIRFDTSDESALLACGNNGGEVRVWTIDANPKKKHFASLIKQQCTSSVRNVAICPDGAILVACCDDATIWKWDAII